MGWRGWRKGDAPYLMQENAELGGHKSGETGALIDNGLCFNNKLDFFLGQECLSRFCDLSCYSPSDHCV